ncbi:hypothetical protein P2A54_20955 [Xanthomonas perforans]
MGLLEHGDDLAVGKAGLLHGTSSGKGTRKFHFWRLLIGGGITLAAIREDFPTIVLGVVTPRRPPVDGESDRRVSVSLSSRADWTRQYILDSELAAAQLPERVRKPGKPIDKPAHW